MFADVAEICKGNRNLLLQPAIEKSLLFGINGIAVANYLFTDNKQSYENYFCRVLKKRDKSSFGPKGNKIYDYLTPLFGKDFYCSTNNKAMPVVIRVLKRVLLSFMDGVKGVHRCHIPGWLYGST